MVAAILLSIYSMLGSNIFSNILVSFLTHSTSLICSHCYCFFWKLLSNPRLYPHDFFSLNQKYREFQLVHWYLLCNVFVAQICPWQNIVVFFLQKILPVIFNGPPMTKPTINIVMITWRMLWKRHWVRPPKNKSGLCLWAQV